MGRGNCYVWRDPLPLPLDSKYHVLLSYHKTKSSLQNQRLV